MNEPKQILIVEDDADIAAIERDYLELGVVRCPEKAVTGHSRNETIPIIV